MSLHDLTYLTWGLDKESSGTAGTFLKAFEVKDGTKLYYKMSNFDSSRGIYGHECINEIVAQNVAKILGIQTIKCDLLHCTVNIQGRVYITWVTVSKDFKQGRSSMSFETFYELHNSGESVPDFVSNDYRLSQYFSDLCLFDYIIYNRDRHGANIEVLVSNNEWELVPLFDHGVSLMFSCQNSEAMQSFNPLASTPVNNYFGSIFLEDNLLYVNDASCDRLLTAQWSYDRVFTDLECITDAVPSVYFDCVYEMILRRVENAKKILSDKRCNTRPICYF